jgi:hypothetical protein
MVHLKLASLVLLSTQTPTVFYILLIEISIRRTWFGNLRKVTEDSRVI